MMFNELSGPTVPVRDQSGILSPDRADLGPLNTLVLSDLHLGEDLAPTATEATRLHVDIVERQLVQFLRHYTRRREDGRPWRLVFNGDLIDFLAITIGPEHPDFAFLSACPSPEEHKYGLRRTPKSAVAVVEAVARRHADVFRALARFLASGNRLDVVCGNHDLELTWPAVQAAFRAGIAGAWSALPDGQRDGAVRADQLAGRVEFHPWFFYDRGAVWIEHGHQYDECCSYEHQLDPRRPGGDDIVMNVDNAGARYVNNRVADAEESWSMLGYLRFGAGLGVRGFFRLALAYSKFLAAMIAAWRHGRARPSAMQERRDSHLARLRQLAERWDMPEETLLALDGARRPPVVGHLRRLLSTLMLDRILLYSGAFLVALASVIWLRMPYAAAVAAGALFGSLAAVRVLNRDRLHHPGHFMPEASAHIHGKVDVRFVVFGHSHEPRAEAVGTDGKMYFNTGTWVPNGKPGILRSFTHVIVRHRESGPTAQLCQWRDGMSRSFTPGWRPAPAAALAPRTIAQVAEEAIAAGGGGPAGSPATVRAARAG
jgi:UDP-2,3-diacylglucosamine pyrophosphatase LpxH